MSSFITSLNLISSGILIGDGQNAKANSWNTVFSSGALSQVDRTGMSEWTQYFSYYTHEQLIQSGKAKCNLNYFICISNFKYNHQ